MPGLSSTLNIAQSSLATNAALTSVVSRNIAGVNDPNYNRKLTELVTNATGTAQLLTVGRAADDALFTHLLSATSASASSSAVSTGLDQLEQTVRFTSTATAGSTSTTTDISPATLLSKMTSALQAYAATPGDDALAQGVVTAAQTLSSSLNGASATVQSVRAQADGKIATAVGTINSLLSQFQTNNSAIMRAKAGGDDATDLLDTRNNLLTQLSQQVGITTTTGANGSMAIYTDSGVTMFQGTARSVAFAPTATFVAGSVGNAVVIDGVPVTGEGATMPLSGGAIAGLATLRDTTTVQYQNQLDQIAQSLVTTFADTDGNGASVPGLFTGTGASATATMAQTGLAASLTVNPNVDPSQGGVLSRLRDGSIGDPAGNPNGSNTTGAASYATHLTGLLAKLDATQAFDATTGGTGSATLGGYAASSVGWLEAARSEAATTTSNRSAAVSQTTTSLSSETGVNLDEQMSKMLDLEHAYQASAELMQTVKQMFGTLINAMQ